MIDCDCQQEAHSSFSVSIFAPVLFYLHLIVRVKVPLRDYRLFDFTTKLLFSLTIPPKNFVGPVFKNEFAHDNEGLIRESPPVIFH